MGNGWKFRWHIAIGLMLLFITPPLIAQDIYVEWAVGVSQPDGQLERKSARLWNAAGRMRVENPVGAGAAKIMRADLKKVWLLNEVDKSYTEKPLTSAISLSATPATALGQATWRATGTTIKIGDWDCQEYLLPASAGQATEWEIWTTSGIQVDPSTCRAIIEILNPKPMGPLAVDEINPIKGFPIRIVAKEAVGAQTIESISTVQKICQDRIDRSLFKPPADYAKMGSGNSAVAEGARPAAPAASRAPKVSQPGASAVPKPTPPKRTHG